MRSHIVLFNLHAL